MNKLVGLLSIVGLSAGMTGLAAAGTPTSLSALVDGSSTDAVFNWDYPIAQTTTRAVRSQPFNTGLASDSDGNLYIGVLGAPGVRTIEKVTAPAGPTTTFATGGQAFRAMTFTPSGEMLAVSDAGSASKMQRFSSAGALLGTIITTGGADRHRDVEVGPDGRGYAVRTNTSAQTSLIDIFDITTGASFGEIVLSPTIRTSDIAIGSDGTIYFVSNAPGRLYKVDPTAGATPIAITAQGSYSNSTIAMGPDGNLYVRKDPGIVRVSTTGVDLGVYVTMPVGWTVDRFTFGNVVIPAPGGAAVAAAMGLVTMARRRR